MNFAKRWVIRRLQAVKNRYIIKIPRDRRGIFYEIKESSGFQTGKKSSSSRLPRRPVGPLGLDVPDAYLIWLVR